MRLAVQHPHDNVFSVVRPLGIAYVHFEDMPQDLGGNVSISLNKAALRLPLTEGSSFAVLSLQLPSLPSKQCIRSLNFK